MTVLRYRPAHTDPAVVARRSAVAAFESQLDTRQRLYTAPAPEPCYCGCPIGAHTLPGDACQDCTCDGYAEKARVLATRDALDVEDQWNEGRCRDNTEAALRLARRSGR